MGFFLNRNNKPKEKTRTFWAIIVEKGSFKGEVKIGVHPIFEDDKRAVEYCKQLDKQQGIHARPFPIKFTDKDIEDWKKKGITFVEK